MCEPVSIMMAVGAVVGVAGGAMSAKNTAKTEGKQEDARRSSLHEQAAAMYRGQADANLETKDKNDEARAQMSETNLTALRNRGTMRAALGESLLTGNSMDRLQNDVENEASRKNMAILDNYDRDYATIFQNQVASTENTKAVLRGSTPAMTTSKVANALNVVSSGFQGASAGAAVGSSYSGARTASTTPTKKA